MTTLLLDELLHKQFKEKVAPIILAKGATVGDLNNPEALEPLLGDSLRLWPVELACPRVGERFRLDFSNPARLTIHDARVFLEDSAARPTGPTTMLVKKLYGEVAICAVDSGSERHGQPDSRRLLALSGSLMTILTDVAPGKNCLHGVAVWANELLPLPYVMQRARSPVITDRKKAFDIQHLKRDFQGFGAACPRCSGSGRVNCPKCAGSGIHKPSCQCIRCGGTGYFSPSVGAGGTCYGCNGTGFLQAQSCYACESGKLTCRQRGIGHLHVHFSSRTGEFTRKERNQDGDDTLLTIEPAQVSLTNWKNGVQTAIQAGATELIKAVADHSRGSLGADMSQKRAIRCHTAHFRQIEECLVRSLNCKGIMELKTIQLARPRATHKRSEHSVIYKFPVRKGSNSWIRQGLPPYPIGTSVRFCKKDSETGKTEIEIPWQGDPRQVRERTTPILAGVSGTGKQICLLIRFPIDIDLPRLPENLLIEPATVPPAALRLIQYLRRWTSPSNHDHGALGVIAGPVAPPKRPMEMRIRDKGISKNRAQLEAVRLGLSDSPLSLFKGPPGTGKTTVITEVVCQAVANGKRVLVCSQSHQAVRNVLERLHAAGGYRMARHGRHEDLQGIEREYSEES